MTFITSTDLALYVALFAMFTILLTAIYYVVSEMIAFAWEIFGPRKFSREQAQRIINRKYNKSVRRASGLTDKEYLFKYGFQR